MDMKGSQRGYMGDVGFAEHCISNCRGVSLRVAGGNLANAGCLKPVTLKVVQDVLNSASVMST